MEFQRPLCLILVLFTLLSSSQAHKFYVGGSDGWVPNPSQNYNQWAGKNRFQVNDTLVFKYKKGSDSVLEVKKDDYDKCNKTNPIKKFEDGDTEFKFDRTGPFYFISGKDGNCEKGQKLIAVVLSLRGQTHTPPPSSGPTPPTTPPSPSPLPSPVSQPPASPPTAPTPSGKPPSSSVSPSPAGISPSTSPSPANTPPAGSPGPAAGTPAPSTAASPAPAALSPSPSPVSTPPAGSPGPASGPPAPSPVPVTSPPSPATPLPSPSTAPPTAPTPPSPSSPSSPSAASPGPTQRTSSSNEGAPPPRSSAWTVAPSSFWVYSVTIVVGAAALLR